MHCPGWTHPMCLQGIDGESLHVRGQPFKDPGGRKPTSTSVLCWAQGSTVHFWAGQMALKVKIRSDREGRKPVCGLASWCYPSSWNCFAELKEGDFCSENYPAEGGLSSFRVTEISFNSRKGEQAGRHWQIPFMSPDTLTPAPVFPGSSSLLTLGTLPVNITFP